MLLALLIFTLIFYNAAEFVSAFGTILCILAYRKSVPAFLKFPGKISYSIYLIHYPLGIVITNALKQILNEKYNWLLLISTTIIITIISWVFYQIFEEYAEKLSKKVKYEIARKYIQ
jgi:peptidoglycan/LPS O-acetylase OafA/YrhL